MPADGRAEAERERERARPLLDPGAAVVVHEPRGLEQLARALDNRAEELPRGDLERHHEAEVLRGDGHRGERSHVDGTAREGDEQVEVDLGERDALGQVELGGERGQELAREPQDHGPVGRDGLDRGRAARVHGDVRALLEADLHAHRVRELPHCVERVYEAGPLRGGARLLRDGVAEDQHADMARLRRDARVERPQRIRVGTRRARRHLGRPVRHSRAGQEHRAGLEEREVGGSARQVAARDVDEPRQQRAAEERERDVERVRQPDRRGVLAVGRAEARVLRLGRERRPHDLGEPARGERDRRLAAEALRGGEPAAGGRDGQHGGDAVVADDARDLLHEVGPVAEVRSPGGRRDPQDAVGLLERAAHVDERVAHLVRGVVDADERGRVAERELDGSRRRGRVEDRAEALRVAAGELLEELHGACGGGGRDARIHSPLEALGRLARQLVPAGRARDRHGVEAGRLDQHPAGARADLGGGAAHDARESDGPRVVRDDQVLRVQGALAPVEGHERLALGRAPDDDAAL